MGPRYRESRNSRASASTSESVNNNGGLPPITVMLLCSAATAAAKLRQTRSLFSHAQIADRAQSHRRRNARGGSDEGWRRWAHRPGREDHRPWRTEPPPAETGTMANAMRRITETAALVGLLY